MSLGRGKDGYSEKTSARQRVGGSDETRKGRFGWCLKGRIKLEKRNQVEAKIILLKLGHVVHIHVLYSMYLGEGVGGDVELAPKGCEE